MVRQVELMSTEINVDTYRYWHVEWWSMIGR